LFYGVNKNFAEYELFTPSEVLRAENILKKRTFPTGLTEQHWTCYNSAAKEKKGD